MIFLMSTEIHFRKFNIFSSFKLLVSSEEEESLKAERM